MWCHWTCTKEAWDDSLKFFQQQHSKGNTAVLIGPAHAGIQQDCETPGLACRAVSHSWVALGPDFMLEQMEHAGRGEKKLAKTLQQVLQAESQLDQSSLLSQEFSSLELSHSMRQVTSYPTEPGSEGARSAMPSGSQSGREASASTSGPADQLEEEAEEEAVEQRDRQEVSAETEQLSPAEKELVHRLHINLGHPPSVQLLRALQAAGAKQKVLEYVRSEYRCPTCTCASGPAYRRKAAFARTFRFNALLAVDTFVLRCNLADGATAVHVLNIICHGTNFQSCLPLPHFDSREVWRSFLHGWIRPFGMPEAILSDGGSEFRGHFESSCESNGILQILIDPEAPWQNGRVERHGGWIKERLETELQSGVLRLRSVADVEDLLASLCAAKNQYLNRGGFSPAQLVFGRNPQVPGDLLQESNIFRPEQQALASDHPAQQEHTRLQQVRARAQELAFKRDCQTRLGAAARSSLHRDQFFRPGEWVFVWRKNPGASIAQGIPFRGRSGHWRGPGLVVLHTGHTVYVSMRARLWRCATEQVRSATSEEILGAELVDKGQFRDLLLYLRGSHHQRRQFQLMCRYQKAA